MPEFKTVEELDKYLEEKFPEGDESTEEEDLQESDESTDSPETTDDDEFVKENEVDDEDDETTEQNVENPEPEKAPEVTQEDYKFGEMRRKLKESQKEIEEQKKYHQKMEEIAAQLGYASADALVDAYEEQKLQEEAKKQNMDPAVLKRVRDMESKISNLESQKQEQAMNVAVGRFRNTLDNMTNQFGLNEAEKAKIINQMDADGYTIEDIARLKNPETFIKGYMSETIAEKRYQEKLATEKKAQKVKETKVTSQSEKQKDLADLLKEEMAAYARENNFN